MTDLILRLGIAKSNHVAKYKIKTGEEKLLIDQTSFFETFSS